MRVAMLRASEEATSGSVIANAERISPSSSGCSHCSFCSGVPNCVSTSMLPVSGAEQLTASGAIAAERPGISGSGVELLEDGRVEMRVAALGDLLLEDGLRRVDLLLHERGQALGELFAAV